MAIERYHFDNDGNINGNSDEKIKKLEAKIDEKDKEIETLKESQARTDQALEDLIVSMLG